MPYPIPSALPLILSIEFSTYNRTLNGVANIETRCERFYRAIQREGVLYDSLPLNFNGQLHLHKSSQARWRLLILAYLEHNIEMSGERF
jgi:hypothetical protein